MAHDPNFDIAVKESFDDTCHFSFSHNKLIVLEEFVAQTEYLVLTFRLKLNDLNWGLIAKTQLDPLELSVNELKQRIIFLELGEVHDELTLLFST